MLSVSLRSTEMNIQAYATHQIIHIVGRSLSGSCQVVRQMGMNVTIVVPTAIAFAISAKSNQSQIASATASKLTKAQS